MGSSHGFGSTTAYYSPLSDSLSLWLRIFCLTLHTIVTRRSILQKVRRHAIIALRLLVSTRFQVLFLSPSGVLFTFPSRYWFTIGHQGVFSLGRWSSRIPTECHVFRRTQDPLRRKFSFDYRALTFYGRPFQAGSSGKFLGNSKGVSYNPERQAFRFGLFPFRSPLLGKSRLLSFPPGTKMFQFPGYPPHILCVQMCVLLHYEQRVAPFGNPRIDVYLRLPGAYRC